MVRASRPQLFGSDCGGATSFACGENVQGIVAEVMSHGKEGAHHQTRADEEHDRESHFRDGQNAARPALPVATQRLPCARQAGQQRAAHGVSRRNGATENGRERGETHGGKQDDPVQLCDRFPREIVVGNERKEFLDAEPGEKAADEAARGGQHEAFDKKLA